MASDAIIHCERKQMKNVTCNKCGWVHFGVSREYAISQVNNFNVYFDTLSKEKQDDYYGGHKSSIDFYERCNNCGGSYKNFRISIPGDCPDGVTIGPQIHFEEN